ncbi:hypothetical protein BpHYR1_048308 [Brachionus plicatilis]|uniref:C2H2-type domain-containing protein n=1 Tax=Brachionus plicatilis TaxID=10195 RepID=A0A3M7Q980_BRAPC|nr:hypothetical protein BpHYR1_048308 [Brachionus plicatilis]
MYSPTSYYNYYNNSYNSNDSGYLSTSVQSSPSSVKTKLNYQAEDNLVEQQSGKKRKFGEEFESKVDLESSGQKSSVAKRPKVLKLKNLESKDVEYKCEVCLNVFNSAAKFLMHQFVHHKNGNSKQCPVCCKYPFFYKNESNINNTINYQQMSSVYQEYPTNNLEHNNFQSYNNSIFYNQYQLPQNFEFNYYRNQTCWVKVLK